MYRNVTFTSLEAAEKFIEDMHPVIASCSKPVQLIDCSWVVVVRYWSLD